MRSALKRTFTLRGRFHCWQLLCLFVMPAHLLDPQIKAFYEHFSHIARALREGGEELRRRWRESRAWDLRVKPKGPRHTFNIYASLFEIRESEDAKTWQTAEASVDLLKDDTRKIGHFLRNCGRTQLQKQAERLRRNVAGLSQLLLDPTVKIARCKRHPLKRFVIAMITDGIWTQQRRFRAGFASSGDCPWCRQATETLRHLWYECPHWKAWRQPVERWLPALQSAAPCVANCFIATKELPHAMLKSWAAIQLAFAALLQARMDAQPRKAEAISKYDEEFPRPPPLPRQAGGRLDFQYTERLQERGFMWPFKRMAWHELLVWSSMLRRAEDEGEPPTILEAYLSFMLVGRGNRWLSELGDDQNGHLIPFQLARFKNALRHFQSIAEAPTLVSPKELTRKTHWPRGLGMPALELLATNLILPQATNVRDTLYREAQKFQTDFDEGTSETGWQNWAPGNPSSQTVEGHEKWAPPLWQLPAVRWSQKGPEPRWRSQCREVRAFWKNLETRCPLLDMGWMRDWGLTCREDLQRLLAPLRSSIRQAQKLLDHNYHAPDRSLHLIGCWQPQERPLCVACGCGGYASKPYSFLKQECVASPLVGSELISSHDQAIRTQLLELQVKLRTLSQVRLMLA